MAIVVGWIHWIVNVSAKNFGLQEENINISKLQGIPLIRKTGWGTTERERDIWTERERKGGCSAI